MDASRDWAVAMLEVNAATPLPANAAAIQAFLEGDMPKPLPAHPTLLFKLLADGDTAYLADAHLGSCGRAQDLASIVGCE